MADEQAARPAYPGQNGAVGEADGEGHAHVDRSAHALDEAHHLGVILPDGHAVHETDNPRVGCELRLENQGVLAV